MARTIPVILDFLARFIGLGDVGGQVQATIRGLQTRVDQMLDRAVDWIRRQAASLASRALGGNPNATPQQRLQSGLREGVQAINRLSGSRIGLAVIRPVLAVIRLRHQMRSLEAVPSGTRWCVRGVVNPEGDQMADKEVAADPTATTAGGLDATRLRLEAVIEVRQSRGVADTRTRDPYIWFVAKITEVNSAQQRIRYQSVNRRQVNTGVLDNADYNVKWVFGNNSQVRLGTDRIVEENAKQEWDDRDIARKVLNYRHHNDQANRPGTEWEHIIEASAGGRHASGNLALTTSQINNRLGVLFGQPYASREAPAGLQGTGGQTLRAYLGPQSLNVKNRWKQHFYANEFHVTVQWQRSERGIWRELV